MLKSYRYSHLCGILPLSPWPRPQQNDAQAWIYSSREYDCASRDDTSPMLKHYRACGLEVRGKISASWCGKGVRECHGAKVLPIRALPSRHVLHAEGERINTQAYIRLEVV